MSSETVKFPAQERTGLLLGVTVGQAAVFVGSVVLFVVVALATHSLPLMFLCTVAICVIGTSIVVPFYGRPGVDWLPVAGGYVYRRVQALTAPRVPDHGIRIVEGVDGAPAEVTIPVRPPIPLRGVELIAVQWPGGEIGVAYDSRRKTWTAAVPVVGSAWSVAATSEQRRLISGWETIIQSVAGSAVARIGWISQATPADPAAIGEAFEKNRADHIGDGHPVLESYRSRVMNINAVGSAHEYLITLTIDVTHRDARAAIRRARKGTPAEGALAVLCAEVQRFVGTCKNNQLPTGPPLDLEGLCGKFRSIIDPFGGYQAHSEADVWPVGWDDRWSQVTVGGTACRVFHVADWPNREVAAGQFLSSLLHRSADAGYVRTCVCIKQPVHPVKAQRQVDMALNVDKADNHTRGTFGFGLTHRRARKTLQLNERAAALTEGDTDNFYAMYVVVAAPADNLDALETGVRDTITAALPMGLNPQWGEMGDALCNALPLGRGLWGVH